MSTRLAGLMTVAVATLTVPALSAQDFEGVIQQRSISVSSDALFTALIDVEIDDAILDGEDEEAYVQALADAVLAMPLSRFTQMADEGEDVSVEEFTIHVKGSRMHVETGGGMGAFGYFIVDADTGTMWMVNPERRIYVKWTQEDTEAMQRQAEESLAALGIDMDAVAGEMEGAEAEANIASLDRTEDINGVTARAYRASAADQTALGWVRDDDTGVREAFRVLSERMEAMAGDEEEYEGPALDDLFWEKGLPVRIQTITSAWGNLESYDVEDILAIDRTRVRDELFVVPADFEEKSLQDLWR